MMFPIPEEKLPQLCLSKSRLFYLEEKMKDIVQQNLTLFYHQNQSKSLYGSRPFHFRFQFYGSVWDLMQMLTAETTSDARRVSSMIHSDLLDAAVLLAIYSHPLNKGGKLAIKWFALETPPTISNIDFVTLQFGGIMTLPDGEEIGMLVWDSIELSEWPIFDSPESQITRGKIRQVLFLQSDRFDPSKVIMTCDGSLKLGNLLPSWFATSLQRGVRNRFVNLIHNLNTTCMTTRIVLDREAWVPNSARKSCHQCQSPFNIFRYRHHCRICGDIFCRQCSANCKLFKKHSDIVKTKARVCVSCLEKTSLECTYFTSHTAKRKRKESFFSPLQRYSSLYDSEDTMKSLTENNLANIDGDDDGSKINPNQLECEGSSLEDSSAEYIQEKRLENSRDLYRNLAQQVQITQDILNRVQITELH